MKAYITEALKTWRKRNAAMLLATQSSEDFLDADLLRTVVESCPTKFFLANPNMDLARARELFHLNHTEAALIQHLRPRQQALLKRPDLSKVINLHVESQADGIDPTPCPIPSARRAAAIAACWRPRDRNGRHNKGDRMTRSRIVLMIGAAHASAARPTPRARARSGTTRDRSSA